MLPPPGRGDGSISVNSVELRRAEPPLVLALDVGTSSCRGSLYDARGRRVEGLECQRTYTPRTTADGGAEFHADRLVDLVREVLDGVLALARPAHRAIAAVGSCSFWHSLLGLDASGRPAHATTSSGSTPGPASRPRPCAQELDERAVHARTGCGLHWSYWPAKLRWLQATQPADVPLGRPLGLVQRIPRAEAVWRLQAGRLDGLGDRSAQPAHPGLGRRPAGGAAAGSSAARADRRRGGLPPVGQPAPLEAGRRAAHRRPGLVTNRR